MTVQAMPSTSGRPRMTASGRSWWERTRVVAGQAFRYSVVGTTGTGIYIGLYLLLDLWTQPVVGNAIAWLITTVATNSVQRRFAFGVSEHAHVHIDQVVGLTSSAVALLVTTLALAALPNADSAAQVAALIV